MTAFDYIVITVLLASVVISVIRGLIKEILSLVSWLVAFVVANTWAQDAAEIMPASLSSWIPGPMGKLIVGYAALFIGTLIVVGLVGTAVGYLIRAAGLSLADRGLGGLFGLARGLVLVLVGVILCGLTSLPQQPVWRNALLAPLAVTAVRTVKPLLPDEWARHVHF